VFWKKSLQAVENKGSEHEKESKESKEKPRGGKLLRGRSLRQQHRNSAGERGAAANTRWVGEEGEYEAGTR
jgi:hypothetical protein